MAWREYLNLFEKYEGNIELATEREIEHADRGMDPATARKIAESEFNRRERTKKNGSNKSNSGNKENQKDIGSDSSFADRLF